MAADVDSALEELWKEAEALVVLGQDSAKRDSVCAEVTQKLNQAWTDQQLDRIPVWLDACCRLRVHESTPIVLALLEQGGAWDHARLMAADAARAVIRRSEERAQAARLLYPAAIELRDVNMAHAARALLGAVLLDGDEAIERSIPFFETWEPRWLDPCGRALCGRLSKLNVSARQSIPGVERLRVVVTALEERCVPSSAADEVGRSVLLMLRALLIRSNEADIRAFLECLLSIFGEKKSIGMAGSASAAKLLCRDHPMAVECLLGYSTGSEFLEVMNFVPEPVFYG